MDRSSRRGGHLFGMKRSGLAGNARDNRNGSADGKRKNIPKAERPLLKKPLHSAPHLVAVRGSKHLGALYVQIGTLARRKPASHTLIAGHCRTPFSGLSLFVERRRHGKAAPIDTPARPH
jgi:hypothetical protein